MSTLNELLDLRTLPVGWYRTNVEIALTKFAVLGGNAGAPDKE